MRKLLNAELSRKNIKTAVRFSLIPLVGLPFLLVHLTYVTLLFWAFCCLLVALLYIYIMWECKIVGINVPRKLLFVVDLIIFGLSMVLLVITLANVNTQARLVLSLLVSGIVPGYALLRIFGFKTSYTWLEWPSLSFALSMGLTPFLFMVNAVFLGRSTTSLAALITFCSALPILGTLKLKTPAHPRNNKVEIKVDVIGGAILFLLLSFSIVMLFALYPGTALVAGMDIQVHFSRALYFVMSPDANSAYPFFHMFMAVVWQLAESSILDYMTVIAFASLVLFASFYVLACAYLGPKNPKFPAMATTVFMVFAGFGWLAFVGFPGYDVPEFPPVIGILRWLAHLTYDDIGVGQSTNLWFWFRPITVSFSIFFLLMYIMTRKDLKRNQFFMLFTPLLVIIAYIHITELLMFNAFICALALFAKDRTALRIKDSANATLAASVIFVFLDILLFVLGFKFMTINGQSFVLGASYAILAVLMLSLMPQFLLRIPTTRLYAFLKKRKWIASVVLLETTVFLVVGLILWRAQLGVFSARYVDLTHYVPLLLYLTLLGVSSLLSIGTLYLVKEFEQTKIVLVLLIITVIGIGKSMAIINVLFADVGYGEDRYLPLLFAANALLAAPFLVETIQRKVTRRKTLSLILLTIVFMSGTLSTSLTTQYWLGQPTMPFDKDVSDAISFMLSGDVDLESPIITADPGTFYLMSYVPTSLFLITYREAIWSSKQPELALFLLSNGGNESPYVVMTPNDYDYVSNYYTEGYIAKHLVHTLSVEYSNPSVTIYKFPVGVPPSENCRTFIVRSEEFHDDVLYAFDMLRLGGYAYTISLDTDVGILQNATTIVLTGDDASSANIVDMFLSSQVALNSPRTIVILDTRGGGPIAAGLVNATGDGHVNATGITGQGIFVPFASQVPVPVISPLVDVIVLAYYTDGTQTVPFALEKTVNDTTMIYVNIHPFIEATNTTPNIHQNESSTEPWYSDPVTNIMAQVPTLLGLSLADFESPASWVYEGSTAFFKNFIASGQVAMTPESISDIHILGTVDARIQDGQDVIDYRNITTIDHTTLNGLTWHSSRVETIGSSGLYTWLRLVNPELKIEKPCKLGITVAGNATVQELIDNGTISFTGNISVLMRKPHFSLTDGNIEFSTFYSLFDSYPALRSAGQDLTIEGEVSFRVQASGSHVFVENLRWKGETQRNPPVFRWNELESAGRVFIGTIVASIPTVFLAYLWTRRRHRSASRF